MWWNDYWTAPWMFFGPVFFIVMMLGCAFMMFMMMRGHRSGRHGGTPHEILKERFARGDIDGHEYEERRRMLDA